MRWCRLAVALAFLVLLESSWPAAESEQSKSDEQTLKNAGVGNDGAALLGYLRKKIDGDGTAAKVKELIKQLEDDDAEKREQATAELTKLGAAALPVLRQALAGYLPSLEVRRRIERIVEKLPLPPEDAVTLASVRLLAQHRPDGALPVLLAYLPLVTDEVLADEVRAALASVGFRDGQPDAGLLQALSDNNTEVRASIAEIVGKRSSRHLANVKALLKDKDAGVRLRVAQVLADQRDAEAIPVLIALLVELPPERDIQAEAVLQSLAGAQAPAVTIGDNATRQKCRDAWNAWWTGFDDKALLDLFRNSTLTDNLREKVQAAIRKLGSEEFDTREQATAAIIQTGAASVPLLLQALKDPDPEVVDRVKKCMAQIQKDPVKSNPASSSRLVALRKPAAAVEVLLAYLPFAHDDPSVDEIQSALNVLAYRDGKPDKALLQALEDKMPMRRAVAAVGLCQEPSGREMPEVRRFLKDTEAAVRLRVSLALAKHKDREAFPILIELFAVLPQEQLWSADELLCRLAESQAPLAPAGTDSAARQRYRDAWSNWWRDHGSKSDLAKLDAAPRTLGYTLLVMPNNGRVAEVGPDGKARWELNGLAYPFDARLLPGGRVLVAEYQGKRVTERTLKNEVVWEKQVMWPIACQRLPNGNTFIATRNQILEVDRQAKDVYAITRQNHDILSAQKLRNGEIGCVTNTQKFIRMDTAGKELKAFPIGNVNNYVQFDALPDGGILIPQQVTNKVVEFDPEGKARWEANVQSPYSAMRLPNGRTLVAMMNLSRLVELDRGGKIVWEQKTDSPPWRARRR